jgi:type IV pilus assembly protein PilV
MGEKKQIPVLAGTKSNNHGFTLLELLVVVSVFSIGLLALASLQLTTIRAEAPASDKSEGSILAETYMGKLLVLPYSDSALSAGTHRLPKTPDGYAVMWQVSEHHPVKNTKTIDLKVTWTEGGKKKAVAMRRVMVHLL